MTPLVLALALLGADPCAGASETCRQAYRDDVITWRTSARVCGEKVVELEAKLAARTATVVETLVPVPERPAPAAEPGYSLETLVLANLAGVLLGALGAVVAVVAAR